MKLFGIPNSEVLSPTHTIRVDNDNNWFERLVQRYRRMGYEVIETKLKPPYSAKMVLQPYKLCGCLLEKKEINKDVDTEPVENCAANCVFCGLYRKKEYLPYERVCTYVKGECLYQDTMKHRRIIRKMIKKYKDYCSNGEKWYAKFYSAYYEDTTLGRIFSKKYESLNYLNPGYCIPRFTFGRDDSDIFEKD